MKSPHTLIQFIEKAHQTHGGAYCYRDVRYVNSHTKVTISCKEHGNFRQEPASHLRGAGCPACGRSKSNTSRTTPFAKFEQQAKEKYGNKFSYYPELWKGGETKTTVCCSKHGDIVVKPYDFIHKKYGCDHCSRIGRGLTRRNKRDSFIERASAANTGSYDYSLVPETLPRAGEVITIICREHGPFTKRIDKHLLGRGCPNCKSTQTSIKSDHWLETLGVEGMLREYRLPQNKLRVVDGYDPKTNTVYQFHGDLWHGNPHVYHPDEINPVTKERMGDLYEKTLRLDDEIVALGYNLVIQWENGVYKLKK